MSEPLKRAVRTAVLRLLAPLVKLLLDAGVGVGEFMSMAKLAYVRAACEQEERATRRGSRPNVTRISVVTGLTRVEVAQILSTGGDEPHRGRQRAERVLTGWWNDRDFQDKVGQPAVLPEKGGLHSFAALCERYSGDPRHATILNELMRVRAVRRRPDGNLMAISRTYATVRWDPDGVIALGDELADHLATLVHNVRNPTRPYLARRVVNTQLDPVYAPMLLRDLEQQAAVTADSMDDALNDPQYRVKPASSRPVQRLGVGIYVFEAPAEADEDGSGDPRSQYEAVPRRTVPRRRSRKG